MDADEAGKIGAGHSRAVTEWRTLWMKHIAVIGQSHTHLESNVIDALAFAAAKEEDPELFQRSVDCDAALWDLQARSAHAIAQSEVRWGDMDKRIEKANKELPKGETK